MMVDAMGIAPRREIEKDTARGGKNGADCFVFSAVCITFVAKIYNMYKKTILAMALLAMSVISTQAQKQPDKIQRTISMAFRICGGRGKPSPKKYG